VAGYHGYEVDLNTLRRKFPLSPRGVRLDELMRLAGRLGLGGRALLLSTVLQLFILVSPFYIQLAVDRVVAEPDGGWSGALAVGFALFTLFNVAAEALRSLVVLRLGNVVSFQIADRLFRHLILLPLSYFERREIGGLISRFNATQPIRDLVTGGVVAVLADGVIAAATLGRMLAYSWLLGAVVLSGLLLAVALRLALFGRLRQRTEHQLEERVRQDSTFIESARAIQAIKLFGREADRAEFWKDLCARYANAALR